MKRYSIKTIAVTLTSIVILSACSSDHVSQTEQADPVKVVLSRPAKKVTSSIYSSGQVESTQTATISTRIMGRITSIKVKPGDKVSKGQLMITLSDADVHARNGQANAVVLEAEAALKDAQKDLERYTELYQQQSASKKELENMTLRYESAKSRVEASRQMKREAEEMLAYTNITAPFNGVVTQKYAAEGSLANPGMPLLAVEQHELFQVTTSVDESEIANVTQGAIADIIIKSNGRAIKGEVSEISPSANPGGRYTIKISFDDKATDGLYSGMHVRAAIASTENGDGQETILVPDAALVRKDQLVGIYTVSEYNTALLRWIKPGRTFGGETEVLSGINENESFISSADGKLYNGVPVQTKESLPQINNKQSRK